MTILDDFEKRRNENLISEYLTYWLKELLEINRPTHYEVQLKEELWDRINAMRTK